MGLILLSVHKDKVTIEVGTVCFSWLVSIILVVLICSLLILLVCVSKILKKRSYEKYKLNISYNFDLYVEYSDYCNIGKKGAKYSKYSDWEEKLKEKHKNLLLETNYTNFAHYLNKLKRDYEFMYDGMVNVFLPLIGAAFAILFPSECEPTPVEFKILRVVAVIGVLVWLMLKEQKDTKDHLTFFEDCMELFQNAKRERKERL